MDNTNELNGLLGGIAGEYFVAGELSKRGYIASITLRNTKGVDILCSNMEATKSVAIQVKTNKGDKTEWILNKKVEDYYADNLFYVFVKLNNNQRYPDFFVVPSKIVAEQVKTRHDKWLSTPGKKGKEHNDTPMRKFKDGNEEFLNKWELLGL